MTRFAELVAEAPVEAPRRTYDRRGAPSRHPPAVRVVPRTLARRFETRADDDLGRSPRGAPPHAAAVRLRELARAAAGGRDPGQPPLRLRSRSRPRLVPAPLRRRRDRRAPSSRSRIHRDRLRRPARRHAERGHGPGCGRPDPGRARSRARLRPLRDRRRQPLRPLRRARGGGIPRRVLQPALPLRLSGSRQDAPADLDRQLPARAAPRPRHRLHDGRALHIGVRDVPARRRPSHRPLQAPLPQRRRAAHRRRPVPRGQGADRGRVLPHVQRALRAGKPDRALQRPPAGSHGAAQRANARPFRLGSDGRDPRPRPRNPDHPAAHGSPPSTASRSPISRCCSRSPAPRRETCAASRAR